MAHRAELRRGLLAGLCALAACIPTAGNQATDASAGFCVKPTSCNPDPGPQPVNCEVAEGALEFAPFMLADFELPGSDPNGNPAYLGEFVYSYTDATAQIYANGDNGFQSPVSYQPVATTSRRCNSDDPNSPSNHVLHITGGHVQTGPDGGTSITGAPFLGWGGGIGVAMQHFAQNLCFDIQAKDLPASERSVVCEPESVEFTVRWAALDLSAWDGVAVWARRAPDSQPGLRVLVGNKYTDDDISYLMYFSDPNEQRYCERVRECACVNGKDCSPWQRGDAGVGAGVDYYCGKPASDPAPGVISGSGVAATNACNITECNQVYPAFPGNGADPQFTGRPCTPYAFRNGNQSSYCFNPVSDPSPAEPDKQCGDHWTYPLHLTTEWQLYLVPFTTMSQQGWAKQWKFFDTSTVSVVRLTWDAGWVDYWIDNLRFYRVRRTGLPDAAASASQMKGVH
jgi:hypothetical protein